MYRSNTQKVAPFILDEIYVRQDEQGRFSLNDLHQASGGEDRHRPSRWIENQQTQALVGELETSGIPLVSESAQEISKAGIPALVTLRGGKTPGTYAARELVYAYAMWISPAFNLKVIRTFDALVSGRLSGTHAPVGKASGLPAATLISLQEQSWKLIKRLEAATKRTVRHHLHGQLEIVLADLGQTAPPLDYIGTEAPAVPPVIAEFWRVYRLLEAEGVRLNHHRRGDLIALNLKQFFQAAAASGRHISDHSGLKAALRLSKSPRFIESKTVNSAVLGQSVFCWMFAHVPTEVGP